MRNPTDRCIDIRMAVGNIDREDGTRVCVGVGRGDDLRFERAGVGITP